VKDVEKVLKLFNRKFKVIDKLIEEKVKVLTMDRLSIIIEEILDIEKIETYLEIIIRLKAI